MVAKMLDVTFDECRFTFNRGLNFPVMISTIPAGVSRGGNLESRCVTLTDKEVRELFNFLGSYIAPTKELHGA